MSEKYTMERVVKIIKSKKCELLESEYVNVKSAMKIKCSCGEVFITSLDKFINRDKTRCNKCSIDLVKNKLKNSTPLMIVAVKNL